jgi:hypothetical protein
LDTATRPAGAVTVTATDAASRGWSSAGNQVAALSGWPETTAPSSVCTNPDAVHPLPPASGTPE